MSVPSTRFASPGARIAALFSLTLLTFLYSSSASAVPSFMRQTGKECGVCHTVYPQLTRLAEVGRVIRFINIPFGAWLIAAPWLLDGIAAPLATWNGVISGAILIALAIPRGRIKDSYAGWDRYVV